MQQHKLRAQLMRPCARAEAVSKIWAQLRETHLVFLIERFFDRCKK